MEKTIVDSLLFRLEAPHPDLVRKIVYSIPEKTILDSESKFLDPAMGGGHFLRAIHDRAVELGVDSTAFKKRLYGIERSIVYINYARWKMGLEGANLRTSNDYDLDVSEMQFDVVVGNPPYQRAREVRNVGSPLWPEFIEKSLARVKDGGIVSLVVPFTWMQKNARSKAWKAISGNDLVRLDPNVDHGFPGVATGGISVITLRKQPYSGATILPDGSSIDIRTKTPSNNKEWNKEVFSFLRDHEILDLDVKTGPVNPSIKSSHWSAERTETHCYEVFYSSAKNRRSMWCDQPIGDHGKLKLAVATYGDMYETLKITTVGCGRQVQYVLGTREELEQIKEKLLSDESRRMNFLMAYGSYHTPLSNVVR